MRLAANEIDGNGDQVQVGMARAEKGYGELLRKSELMAQGSLWKKTDKTNCKHRY